MSLLVSLTVRSVWQLIRQSVPTNTIEITEVWTAPNATRFKAKYIGIDDDSVFRGEIWVREKEVINIRQHHQSARYASFHTGILKTDLKGPEYYEGSWYDVQGHAGLPFRLNI